MDGSRLLVALALLAPSASWAGDVFKSVDADGHVVYSDHADPAAQLVHLEDTFTPPSVIHFCWTNCFTLELDNGVYKRADGSDETWTVERFTPESFLLHRHDAPAAWNGFKADVAYEGRIASGQLVSVTVGGRPVDDIQAAWGPALETLPGSNAERDQRNSAPPDGFNAAMDAEVRTAEPPPPLQDEMQPPVSQDGYLWIPGYWAWGGGYHWIPGAWVAPPRVGLLWTPGYWAFAGTAYVFHPGYWDTHVGYYGGICYGFGYAGVGFAGGRWVGNTFAYNRAVNNVNPGVVHNIYNEAPPVMPAVTKVSYNGGPGGTTSIPTAQERMAITPVHKSTPSPTPLIARRAVSPVSAPPPAPATRAVAHAIPKSTPNDESRPGETATRPAAPKAAVARSAPHPASR
jgi:hypothetical protein